MLEVLFKINTNRNSDKLIHRIHLKIANEWQIFVDFTSDFKSIKALVGKSVCKSVGKSVGKLVGKSVSE